MRTSPRGGLALADVVFFLDRALGKNDVRLALQAAGARVETHADHFDDDTEDHVWIEFVGKKGWVILSKDRHLKNNVLELRALFEANTASFLLTTADATGRKMGETFVGALGEMLRFLGKFPKPFVATVSPSGKLSLVHSYASMAKRMPGKRRN